MSGSAKATVFIDNDRVIVTEYRFAPGANTGWHKHGHDYVVVPLMDGKVRLETPTGPAHAEMKKGVPYFRHAGVEHDVINANDTEYAFIEIELKQEVTMMRSTLFGFGLLCLASSAQAAEFAPSAGGSIEFTLPSNNIGCIYRDEEGSGLVLECDRVKPSYARVRLFQDGKPEIYRNVGDPSCCGAENYLGYGESWKKGPFSCAATTAGLRCNNGEHGFSMSRKGIKTY